MSTFKQHTAHANNQYSTMEKASEGFGKRDETVLSSAFPESPYLYATDLAAVTDVINKLGEDIFQGTDPTGPHVINGEVQGATAYWGQIDVESGQKDIDINYKNAPDVAANTKTTDAAGVALPFGEGKGAPETPYVPPLTSPGAGNFTELHQPGLKTNAPDTHAAMLADEAIGQFGSGGSHLNPSAQTINGQTIGSYTKGDS